MKPKENCKGCRLNVTVKTELIDDLVSEIKNSNEFAIVSSEVYSNRLKLCAECKWMEYGTTCNQCGCFVKVRALLKDKDCPSPKGDLWMNIVNNTLH